MTNKANFKNIEITVSDLSKTVYCSLVTVHCPKSKANQSQFRANLAPGLKKHPHRYRLGTCFLTPVSYNTGPMVGKTNF